MGARLVSPGMMAGILVVMAIVFVLLTYEAWRWSAREQTRMVLAQFRRRMIAGIVLEAILLLWILFDRVTRGWPPVWRLMYLAVLVLLGFVPMFIAIREWAFTVRQTATWKADLVRDMARERQRPHAGSNGNGNGNGKRHS